MSGDVTMFGPYRLDELLGTGGMGEVWRAYDTRRERDVALKRLTIAKVDNTVFRARFQREARLVARLSSAHVIPIHDFGEIDGRPFLDMRLVTDGDLASVLAREPTGLGSVRAVEVVAQVADALDAAHDRGMIHRDVKPSNVMVDRVRAREFCYLADFGIAKILDDTTGAARPPLTEDGTVIGTPGYMAPELFTADSAGSVGSDVYALGCLLFELLTGRRPFESHDAAVLMHRHLHGRPPRPSDSTGGSDGLAVFDAVVGRALAKEAGERYPSAGALAQAALDALDGPAVQRPVHSAPFLRSDATTVTTPAMDTQTGTPAAETRANPAAPTGTGRLRPRRKWLVVGVVGALLIAGSGVLVAVRTATPRPDTSSAPQSYGARPMAAPVSEPRGIAISPDGRTVFVAGDLDQGTVSLVNPDTDTLTSTVPVGSGPGAIAISADGRRGYVTNLGVDPEAVGSLSILDLATGSTIASVPVGVGPTAVALSPDGRRAWVTNGGSPVVTSRSVSVVDTERNVVVGTARVERGPQTVVLSPDGRTAYVTNSGYPDTVRSSVSVVDTESLTVRRTVDVGDAPIGIVLSRDGRMSYVAANGTTIDPVGAVAVVDNESGAVLTRVPSGGEGPFAVALTPDGRRLLVTNGGGVNGPGTSVSVIDTATNRVVAMVQVGRNPYDVVAAPDNRRAFVTTATGLWVVDLP